MSHEEVCMSSELRVCWLAHNLCREKPYCWCGLCLCGSSFCGAILHASIRMVHFCLVLGPSTPWFANNSFLRNTFLRTVFKYMVPMFLKCLL